jgi:hypothetical protein
VASIRRSAATIASARASSRAEQEAHEDVVDERADARQQPERAPARPRRDVAPGDLRHRVRVGAERVRGEPRREGRARRGVAGAVGAEHRPRRGQGQGSRAGRIRPGGAGVGVQQRANVVARGDDDDRARGRETQGEEVAVARMRRAQDAERVAVEGDGLRERPGRRAGREVAPGHAVPPYPSVSVTSRTTSSAHPQASVTPAPPWP